MGAKLTVCDDYTADNDAISRRFAALKLADFVASGREVPDPVPSCEAFASGDLVRLPGSARCFYRLGDAAQGVIAYKGLEPLAADYEQALEFHQEQYDNSRLERFVVAERKLPCAMTVDEARTEAEAALDIQLLHLATYGTFARVPVPLFVIRLPEDVTRRAREQFRKVLSARSFGIAEGLMESGLGAYVYYYPALPIRVNTTAGVLPQDFRTRRELLLSRFGLEERLERWAALFARMLLMKRMPATPYFSTVTGACLQPVNVVLDGGFVDLDSVTSFEDLEDEGRFLGALHMSFMTLVLSISRLLLSNPQGLAPPVPLWESTGLPPQSWVLAAHLSALVRDKLSSEACDGAELDRRVAFYFERPNDLDRCLDAIAALSPSQGSVHMSAEGFKFGTWIERFDQTMVPEL
jgi:hypothetical protein